MTTPDDVTNFTRGDNVTLQCTVSGDVTDDVHVTWSKDGDIVIDSRRSVVVVRYMVETLDIVLSFIDNSI